MTCRRFCITIYSSGAVTNVLFDAESKPKTHDQNKFKNLMELLQIFFERRKKCKKFGFFYQQKNVTKIKIDFGHKLFEISPRYLDLLFWFIAHQREVCLLDCVQKVYSFFCFGF